MKLPSPCSSREKLALKGSEMRRTDRERTKFFFKSYEFEMLENLP